MLNIKNYTKHLALFIILVAISLFIVIPNSDSITHNVTITFKKTNTDLNIIDKIQKVLNKKNIDIIKIHKNKDSNTLTLQLNTKEDKITLTKILSKNNNSIYTITVDTCKKVIPSYLQNLKKKINLGLDLRDGVHFLIKVDIKKANYKNKNTLILKLHKTLRKNKIKYNILHNHNKNIILKFKDNNSMNQALKKN